MEFDKCIKIRKRGFNYYTDYIEKYFDDAFSKYGFHLVKNPEHFEHSVYVLFDDSPWMTVASKWLDELDEDLLGKLSVDISESFKAPAIVEPYCLSKQDTIIECHFSCSHNAFEEPPFIKEGLTVLKWYMTDTNCKSDKPFSLACLNYGGISKGLELIITGGFVEDDTVTLDPLYIYSFKYDGKKKERIKYEAKQQKIILSEGNKAYLYDFAEFEFPEGINQFSAKLRGKKGQDERNNRLVYLYLIASGDQRELDGMSIALLPKSNKSGGVELEKFELPPDLGFIR